MVVNNSVIAVQNVPRRTCHTSEELSFGLVYIDTTDIRSYRDNNKIVSKNENGYTSLDHHIILRQGGICRYCNVTLVSNIYLICV